MLDNPRQKALGPNPDLPALFICSLHSNFAITGNLAVNIFNTQTAFVIFFDRTIVFNYFRVYKDGKSLVVFIVKVIPDNYYSLGLVDLDSGQGNTNLVWPARLPVQSGRLHIINDSSNLVAEHYDFF